MIATTQRYVHLAAETAALEAAAFWRTAEPAGGGAQTRPKLAAPPGGALTSE
jgi:hypothetical protein